MMAPSIESQIEENVPIRIAPTIAPTTANTMIQRILSHFEIVLTGIVLDFT
jgi:hypothetical protein